MAAGRTAFSIREFFAFRDQLDELDLVEYHGMSFTLLGHGYPSNVSTGVVSYNFFGVLGVEPQLGRFFIAARCVPLSVGVRPPRRQRRNAARRAGGGIDGR